MIEIVESPARIGAKEAPAVASFIAGRLEEIDPKPGDVLVFTTPKVVSAEAKMMLSDMLTQVFGRGNKILVLDCGGTLESMPADAAAELAERVRATQTATRERVYRQMENLAVDFVSEAHHQGSRHKKNTRAWRDAKQRDLAYRRVWAAVIEFRDKDREAASRKGDVGT